MYYKDMEAWKEAINLVTDIYRLSDSFPKNELFGLTSQIRRCVVSIPANLAEGAARYSTKETSRFIDIALGSIAELDTHSSISENLGYVNNTSDIQKKQLMFGLFCLDLKNILKIRIQRAKYLIKFINELRLLES